MSAGTHLAVQTPGVSTKPEATSASVLQAPRVIPTSQVAQEQLQQYDQNAPRMMIVPVSSPAKDPDASILVPACLVETMPSVLQRLTLPGAVARVASRRIPTASACLNA